MRDVDPIFREIFQTQLTKGDSRRAEIIQASIIAFSRDGFAGGTFDHIAKRLKTRRSHIAYYYKDKEELLSAVIQYIIANAQRITVELVSSKTSPEEQILAMAEAAFIWAEKYPDQTKVLLLFYSICASDTRFRKLNTQVREAGFQRIHAILKTIKKGADPKSMEETARCIQAVMTGMVVDQVSTDLDIQGGFKETTLRICRRMLAAL